MPREKFSVDNMELIINVKDDLGISGPVSGDIKEAMGEAVLDIIRNRTSERQRSVTGGKFKQYSKAYAEKKGVSRTDVDLTVSTDMLSSMNVKSVSGPNIVLAFDDSFQDPIAYNHNVGDTLPKRKFFGVQKQELRAVSNAFKSDIKSSKEAAKEAKEEKKKQDKEIKRVSNLILKGISFG